MRLLKPVSLTGCSAKIAPASKLSMPNISKLPIAQWIIGCGSCSNATSDCHRNALIKIWCSGWEAWQYYAIRFGHGWRWATTVSGKSSMFCKKWSKSYCKVINTFNSKLRGSGNVPKILGCAIPCYLRVLKNIACARFAISPYSPIALLIIYGDRKKVASQMYLKTI